MTFSIFARGFWLQTRIALSLFIVGIIISMLAMSFGVSPKTVTNSSTKLQDLSGPFKAEVEKTFLVSNKYSWVYFLFGIVNWLFPPAISYSLP